MLLSPGGSGTITAVYLEPGDQVTDGAPILAVDGITVRGCTSPEVFYRPLSGRETGPDVAALQTYLAFALPDLTGPTTGTYDQATRTAVRAYERSIGFGVASGIFDPSWLVRLPKEPFSVESVDLMLGDVPPGPGDVIASATPRRPACDRREIHHPYPPLPPREDPLI